MKIEMGVWTKAGRIPVRSKKKKKKGRREGGEKGREKGKKGKGSLHDWRRAFRRSPFNEK